MKNSMYTHNNQLKSFVHSWQEKNYGFYLRSLFLFKLTILFSDREIIDACISFGH